MSPRGATETGLKITSAAKSTTFKFLAIDYDDGNAFTTQSSVAPAGLATPMRDWSRGYALVYAPCSPLATFCRAFGAL